jgi:hypothetical protein
MKLLRDNQRAKRLLYVAGPALFLFFLIESTPHYVHHAFDHDQSEAESCLVFSVAKGCHLKPPASFQLPVIKVAIGRTALSLEVWIPYAIPSPISQRAPPLA